MGNDCGMNSLSTTIESRLDHLSLTRLHLAIMAACTLGFAFDLFEISLGGVLSAVFSSASHKLDVQQLSLLLAAAYLGAIVGAPTLGWLADRCGRSAILTAALLWLGSTSMAFALSDNSRWITALRLLSGLSLGAYPPLMIAFLTDILPPKRRGMLIMILVAFASLGPPTGIFLVRWLTPVQPLGFEAWRWAFFVGGIGSVFSGLVFRRLPESPRWLAAIGNGELAEAACRAFERSAVIWQIASFDSSRNHASHEVNPPRATLISYRHELIVTACLYFLSPWATVAFPLLSGAVLVEKGASLSDTLLYLAISTIGTVLGTVIAALFIDRIERRTALSICAGVMTLLALCFGASTTPLWLKSTILAFSVVQALYVPSLSVYAAEMFPTRLRGTATSSTWAINRFGSALAPLVLLPVLHSSGVMSMFVIIAGALILSVALLLMFGPPGRAGMTVT